MRHSMPRPASTSKLDPVVAVYCAGYCTPSIWQVVNRAAAERYCGRRGSAQGKEQEWTRIPDRACNLPLPADAIGTLPSTANHLLYQLAAKHDAITRETSAATGQARLLLSARKIL